MEEPLLSAFLEPFLPAFLEPFLPAFLESLLPAFLLHREVAALVFLCRHCQLLRGGNLLQVIV